jgi:hypothetical protein
MAAFMVHDQKCGDRVRIRDGLSSLRYERNDLIQKLTGKWGTITSVGDEIIRAVFGACEIRFWSSELVKVSSHVNTVTTSLCLQVHVHRQDLR